MIIIKKAKQITPYLSACRLKGEKIGFVPTMGALHDGHIRLMKQAKAENNQLVCSIFVNPTQFNDPKDFENYPVTIQKDIFLLEQAGCNMLFLPDRNEVYPNGTQQLPHFELGQLETVLDGQYRPGHFQGVCQVVDRLLTMVMPDKLYLGQKDFQQCLVLKKMAQTNFADLEIVICPTQREANGLAMSSRNLRLNEAERKKAVTIYNTLQYIKNAVRPGNLLAIKQQATTNLTGNGFKVDYVEIAEAENLELISEWDGKSSIVILIAAFLNEVRLIDNMILNP